jgi:hypothetical protein
LLQAVAEVAESAELLTTVAVAEERRERPQVFTIILFHREIHT